MDRYTARWTQIPLEQYDALPPEARRQVDERIQELLAQPQGPPGSYDPPSDQWTTTYGDGAGLILYAVVPTHRRVLILRLV